MEASKLSTAKDQMPLDLATLTDEEKKKLADSVKDTESLKQVAESISMLIRAFNGQPIEPDDIIRNLTNVKDITERSNFPTYPMVQKQVYLRMLATFIPEAGACKDWADCEAAAMTSYRGLSREQYVEMAKSKNAADAGQQLYFGMAGQTQKQPEKRGFLDRFRKHEPEGGQKEHAD